MFIRVLGESGIRSSRSHWFFRIGVLKNFAILTGKHLCWSLFFNKVAGLLLKRDFNRGVLWEHCKIFKKTFFYRTPPVAVFVNGDLETYLGSCQISMMHLLTKIVNSFYPPPFFAKLTAS